MKDLTESVQTLAYNFAKYHYNKYLETKHISKIEETDILSVVEGIFTDEKSKELKLFIRKSLKNICGDNYNSFAVENIINEMFSDKKLVIERICLEIRNFQK